MRRALLRLLNAGPWSGTVGRWACLHAPSAVPVDVVVAVPARDESARIGSCLDACARSAAFSGLRVRLAVLVNGTTDTTARQVLDWARRHTFPLVLVDIDLAPAVAHAGGARRLALDIAGLGVTPETALLTTDADTRPGPSWIAANVTQLRTGAHLVCGRVALDPMEAARLPACIEAVGEIEGRYKRAALELGHRLDPDPWNPWPHHGQASGASLGIRAGDLAAVGGVPLVPCGEDRALARRVRSHGMAVVHADDVHVEVSCRLLGRAPGGMADALRERLHDPDPSCDEALEPATLLLERLVARARLRALWPRGERSDALARFGADRTLARQLARIGRFETAWARFEDVMHAPRRRRMRTSDLRRELPVLHALLESARDRCLDRGDTFTSDRATVAPSVRRSGTPSDAFTDQDFA